MARPERRPCECEHVNHTSESPALDHRYGFTFDSVEATKTEYGTFNLCGSCRERRHMQLDKGPFRSRALQNQFRVGLLRTMFPQKLQRMQQGKCPICGNDVTEKEFRTGLDLAEFHISGMCQRCQDYVFKVSEDKDDSAG